MENKIIPIPTDSRTFYRQYVALLNPLIDLRQKELDVLAELLYFNNKLKDIDEVHRWKIIMDIDTKHDISKYIGISISSLDNNLSSLRKRGIILNNKINNPLLLVYPGDKFQLVYDFKLDDK